MRILINILGWAGAILFLIAYALVSLKKVEVDSLLYQGINILAGILLIINTLYLHAYPSLVMNTAWIGIAVVTLARKYSVRK